MAGIGASHNEAFQAGTSPVVNSGHANDHSITLGDSGLQADSARWAALTPHGVLNSATGAASQDDGAWEQMERGQGGYEPGSMTKMQDQLDAGNGMNIP